jgi:type IV secretory pathway TrbD component
MYPESVSADRHHVCKVLIRPLTLFGVERRLFFLALLLGAATFNLFYSFLTGLLVFALIYGTARIATAVDAQLFAIALRSLTNRPRYDAARWTVGNPR